MGKGLGHVYFMERAEFERECCSMRNKLSTVSEPKRQSIGNLYTYITAIETRHRVNGGMGALVPVPIVSRGIGEGKTAHVLGIAS